MIITCPNCNKKFKIDEKLIPEEGRDLKCGSCNYVWFYKIEEENNDILQLKEEIVTKSIETKVEENLEKKSEKNQLVEKYQIEINNKKKEKNSKKRRTSNLTNNTENKGNKIFSYLIVFFVSFVALIILLDTLKTPLINVFPELEIILFNLFETLKDIELFIIDLF